MPNATGASLILSDGDREFEFVYGGEDGAFLQEFDLLSTSYDVTAAETPDGEGRRPVRKRPQVVTESFKFAVSAYDAAPFWDAVDEIQELVASVQSRGGTLAYIPPGGDRVTFDLNLINVDGLPQSSTLLSKFVIEGCQITYERDPYGRMDPVTIFTGQPFAGPIDSVELERVPGHVDALVDLTLEDASSTTRGFVEIGEAFEYDDDESLQIGLPDLLLTDTAGSSQTRAGSASTNVARATLSTEASTVCRTGPLLQIGKKRIRVRAWATTAYVQVRLAWHVGDAPLSCSRWKTVPAENTFVDFALDSINIERAPAGTHTWEAFIQARTVQGVADVDIDFITPFPADRYFVAMTPNTEDAAIATVIADDFDQTSGDYDGKTMPIGGVADSGGDSTPFTVDVTWHFLKRAATGDTADVGAYVFGGSALTDCRVSVEVGSDGGGSPDDEAYRGGVLFRYSDDDNYAFGVFERFDDSPDVFLAIYKKVAGSVSPVKLGEVLPFQIQHHSYEVLHPNGALQVEARSNGQLRLVAAGGRYSIDAWDEDFVHGEALGSGKAGVYDERTGGTLVRYYNKLRASSLSPCNAVIWEDRSLNVLHDAALRQSADGSAVGKVPQTRGRYLTVPPATRAGRKTLLAVRARQLNVDAGFQDIGLDDELNGTLQVTPRVLMLAG